MELLLLRRRRWRWQRLLRLPVGRCGRRPKTCGVGQARQRPAGTAVDSDGGLTARVHRWYSRRNRQQRCDQALAPAWTAETATAGRPAAWQWHLVQVVLSLPAIGPYHCHQHHQHGTSGGTPAACSCTPTQQAPRPSAPASRAFLLCGISGQASVFALANRTDPAAQTCMLPGCGPSRANYCCSRLLLPPHTHPHLLGLAPTRMAPHCAPGCSPGWPKP